MVEKKEENTTNKVAIVTGGSRGIGAEIVKMLAKEGYNVILNYNKSRIQAEEIAKQYGNVYCFKADVSNSQNVQELVDYTYNKFGRIDLLVNNAGIYKFNLIQDISENEWNEIINVNLKSVFLCSQAVIKYMLKRKEGCIINISSIDGQKGAAGEVHYVASKAGIDGITKGLARELGPSNIRVNSIAPGAIKTDINKDVTDEDWKVVIEETPLMKLGTTKDIANCVKWLIEDNFTTGQVISVNGGWNI